jgi:hypothetical protein
VSQAAVSNWESGGRAVTIDNLLNVARVLRVEPGALLPEGPPAVPQEPPLTDAERAAAFLFARSCVHPGGEACTECDARAREVVAAVTPAVIAACPDCVKSEAELLSVAAVVNVVGSGRSPFAAPMLVQGSLSWEVANAISRGRPRGIAGSHTYVGDTPHPLTVGAVGTTSAGGTPPPETSPTDNPELLPRKDIPARNTIKGAYVDREIAR